MTLHQTLAAPGPAKHAGGGQHGEMGTGGQGGCLVSGKESQRAHTGGMEECCSYLHTHTHTCAHTHSLRMVVYEGTPGTFQYPTLKPSV